VQCIRSDLLLVVERERLAEVRLVVFAVRSRAELRHHALSTDNTLKFRRDGGREGVQVLHTKAAALFGAGAKAICSWLYALMMLVRASSVRVLGSCTSLFTSGARRRKKGGRRESSPIVEVGQTRGAASSLTFHHIIELTRGRRHDEVRRDVELLLGTRSLSHGFEL
jgi:hypothetical protein